MTGPAERRALGQVTRELREEPMPPIDWDRLEASLARRLAEARSSVPRRWSGPLLAAAAVAAGLGGLWLLGSRTPTPVASSASPAAVTSADGARGAHDFAAAPGAARIDGETLAIGGAVAAPLSGLEVVHGRRARWTLSPGGRARLLEAGGRLTIALESGALRAEVTSGMAPEGFAVEVAGTRVAVQGTIFRVERRAERVEVAVERGAVVVGPASDRGRLQGTRLTAPARGEFTFQGLPAEAPDSEASTAPSASPPPARPAPRPRGADPRGAPSAPSVRPGELEAAAYGVTAAVQRCFARLTPAVKGGHVTAEVAVTLVVAPDGGLAGLDFAPPLAPAVGDCSQAAARRVHLPAPGVETRIVRRLSLVR